MSTAPSAHLDVTAWLSDLWTQDMAQQFERYLLGLPDPFSSAHQDDPWPKPVPTLAAIVDEREWRWSVRINNAR